MRLFHTFQVHHRKWLWAFLVLCCAVIALVTLTLLAGQQEAQSTVRLSILRLNPASNTAIFLLTNTTAYPASIKVAGIDVHSNTVWVDAQVPASGNFMILQSYDRLEVPVQGPDGFSWRVRFTSVEKKTGLSALGFRVQWFLKEARTASTNGFKLPVGEIYHDLELLSDEIVLKAQDQQ